MEQPTNAANGTTTIAQQPPKTEAERAAKAEEVLRELTQVPPFSADLLPYLLRDFSQELADRYGGVPQADLALACIATAGTFVSPHAKLETGWGKTAIPSNLLVIFAPKRNSNLAAAVQHIVAPVLAQQSQIIQRRVNADPAILDKEIALAQSRTPSQDAYNSHSSPPRRDLAQCDQLHYLHELLRYRKPIIAVNGLERATLLRALSQSVDGGLFCYSEALAALPAISPGRNGASVDFDLLWHCLNRVPILGDYDCGNVMFPEASLGGVVIATPNAVEGWLAHMGEAKSPADGSLAIRSDAGGVTVKDSVFTRLVHERGWAMRLAALYLLRSAPPEPYFLTMEARIALFKFHNKALSWASRLPDPAGRMVMAWPHLAVRIALGVHFTNNTGSAIEAASVEAGVELARHFGSRQLVAWSKMQAKGQGDTGEGEVELLLMRIKIKGPLTRRQLYRTYDDQRKAVHDPAILRLLTDGRIVEDEQGRLLPAEIKTVTATLPH